MAKIFCKYHSNIPARFYCKSCNVNLCSSCYKLDDTKEYKQYICPICQKPLTSLGMANVITPFWERLPNFFKFPFNIYTLSLMLLISASIIGVILFAVFIMISPLIGTLLLLTYIASMFFIIYRYGFALLKYASEGYLDPYEIEGGTGMIKNNIIPIKMFIVLVIVSAISYAVGHFGGEKASIAFTYFLAFITPASIMMMGVTGSFFHSINPIALAILIKNVGWSYLALLFMSTTLNSGWYSLYEFLPRTMLIAIIMVPISIFISCYLVFVMFQMMGYVIYQYHEKLGYKVDIDFDETHESKTNEKGVMDNEIQEINILVHEGKLEEAKTRLMEKVKKSPGNMQLHDYLHNMLLKLGEYELLSRHGNQYATELIKKEKILQAAQVCENCARNDKTFKISDPYHSITIAEMAVSQGLFKAAVQLLNGFDKRFPSNPNMDKVALLLAKAVCEGMGKDKMAKKILENSIKVFPNSKLRSDMEQYLIFVNKLNTTTT